MDDYGKPIPTNDFIPYLDVQHLFHEGDHVVVTEKIRSNQVYICRDELGRITVTSKRMGKLGLVLPEYRPETKLESFKRWACGKPRPRNYFWQAAANSGIIGIMRNWPKIGAKIEVFGSLVPSLAPGYPYSDVSTPPSVLVERVIFDGKEQGYHSFFPHWVPMFDYGPFDEVKHLKLARGLETISGKKLHPRDGILIRHTRLQFLKDGRPLIAAVFPKDVELWTGPEAA